MNDFEVGTEAFLDLLNVIPARWLEIKNFFGRIYEAMPQQKYAIDDKNRPEYRVMDDLRFPHSGKDVFYGLHKKWMPVPSVFILIPVLRYVPLIFEFYSFYTKSLSVLLKLAD